MEHRKRELTVILMVAFGVFIFMGCATVPTREALPTYYLNGANYISLASLCDLRGINLEYDTFAKKITLNRATHVINLMVGETLAVVDGRPEHLRHPVDIYEGMLVVPYRFKEQVIDNLFKEAPERVGAWTKVKRVVVDAGHGGNDPGAIGRTGIREKIVTLDIAKRIENILRAEGIQVVMTRSTDKFIPLARRVEIANDAKADLFLSIHANANRVRSLNGFEIYYVSQDVDDSGRAISAAREYALDLADSDFAAGSQNLKAILWDMVYTYNRQEAIELSRSICRAIDDNLNTKIIGVKGARFYVLKGANIPAVLIETGFLSNPEEERMLKNNFYRQKIAEAITEGIHNYDYGLALAEANN